MDEAAFKLEESKALMIAVTKGKILEATIRYRSTWSACVVCDRVTFVFLLGFSFVTSGTRAQYLGLHQHHYALLRNF